MMCPTFFREMPAAVQDFWYNPELGKEIYRSIWVDVWRPVIVRRMMSVHDDPAMATVMYGYEKPEIGTDHMYGVMLSMACFWSDACCMRTGRSWWYFQDYVLTRYTWADKWNRRSIRQIRWR